MDLHFHIVFHGSEIGLMACQNNQNLTYFYFWLLFFSFANVLNLIVCAAAGAVVCLSWLKKNAQAQYINVFFFNSFHHVFHFATHAECLKISTFDHLGELIEKKTYKV